MQTFHHRVDSTCQGALCVWSRACTHSLSLLLPPDEPLQLLALVPSSSTSCTRTYRYPLILVPLPYTPPTSMAQTFAPYSQSPPKPKIEQNYMNNNGYSYYDNPQADAPQTEVTANSPSLPTAPHAYYPPYMSASKPDNSYAAQIQYGYTLSGSQIPEDSHMSSYVPNTAFRFPHSVSIASVWWLIVVIQFVICLEQSPPARLHLWKRNRSWAKLGSPGRLPDELPLSPLIGSVACCRWRTGVWR